jgi:hypothetical protein
MMVEAFGLLLHQLNAHLAQLDGAGAPAQPQAILGNIALLDRQEIATELENRLVLSLVKIEEERALKNGRTCLPGPSGEALYRNRPLHLNLFVLFTANYRNYVTGLRRLTQLLNFFQGKQNFTPANSPGALPPAAIADFSLTLDLMSPSFEEVNHLWGFLGAKQLPFALYRCRLIALTDLPALESTGFITEIDVQARDATA